MTQSRQLFEVDLDDQGLDGEFIANVKKGRVVKCWIEENSDDLDFSYPEGDSGTEDLESLEE